MSHILVLQFEAIADIQEAYQWYEQQRIGLGDEFIEEIEKYYTLITESPQFYGFINEKFRRIKMRRFPFRIIFEISEHTVIVIAVEHFHRNKSSI